jgi:hypothetical protein
VTPLATVSPTVTSGVPLPYLTSQSPFVINPGNSLYSNLGYNPFNPGLTANPLLNPYGFGPYANPYNLGPFTNPLANPFAANPFTTPYNPLWGVPGLTTAVPPYVNPLMNPYYVGPNTNPLASFYYPGLNNSPFVRPYSNLYPNPYLNSLPNLYPNPYLQVPSMFPQPVYPGWPYVGPVPTLVSYPNYMPGFYPQPVNPWTAMYGNPLFPGFGGVGGSPFGGAGLGTFGSGLPVGYGPAGGY